MIGAAEDSADSQAEAAQLLQAAGQALADLHDAESFARFSDRDPRLIEKLLRRVVERRALFPMPGNYQRGKNPDAA